MVTFLFCLVFLGLAGISAYLFVRWLLDIVGDYITRIMAREKEYLFPWSKFLQIVTALCLCMVSFLAAFLTVWHI